jgi:hypothetical protein
LAGNAFLGISAEPFVQRQRQFFVHKIHMAGFSFLGSCKSILKTRIFWSRTSPMARTDVSPWHIRAKIAKLFFHLVINPLTNKPQSIWMARIFILAEHFYALKLTPIPYLVPQHLADWHSAFLSGTIKECSAEMMFFSDIRRNAQPPVSQPKQQWLVDIFDKLTLSKLTISPSIVLVLPTPPSAWLKMECLPRTYPLADSNDASILNFLRP